METLCPPDCHRNGFVATHALGNMMYGLMVYGLMYGLRYSSIKQKLFSATFFISRLSITFINFSRKIQSPVIQIPFLSSNTPDNNNKESILVTNKILSNVRFI